MSARKQYWARLDEEEIQLLKDIFDKNGMLELSTAGLMRMAVKTTIKTYKEKLKNEEHPT